MEQDNTNLWRTADETYEQGVQRWVKFMDIFCSRENPSNDQVIEQDNANRWRSADETYEQGVQRWMKFMEIFCSPQNQSTDLILEQDPCVPKAMPHHEPSPTPSK